MRRRMMRSYEVQIRGNDIPVPADEEEGSDEFFLERERERNRYHRRARLVIKG